MKLSFLMSYCTSMEFPVGYSDLLLMLLVPTLNLLLYLRKSISTLCRCHTADSDAGADVSVWRRCNIPLSALLFREFLPVVVKFSDLVNPSADSCAVCFNDFEGEDEIRRLTNCRHIFHRSCLDRWMGYDQRTCPLCRTSLVPNDIQGTFNEKLLVWTASGDP